MTGILLVSDRYLGEEHLLTAFAGEAEAAIPRQQVPSPDRVSEHDLCIVLGPLFDLERSRQLLGALQSALVRGITVVFAYPTVIENADQELIGRLTGANAQVASNTGSRVRASTPEFEALFDGFGNAASVIDLPDDHESLGRAVLLGAVRTVAFSIGVGAGTVYVVPYHLPDLMAHEEFIRTLTAAVRAHRSGRMSEPPEFLADLRLPGEQDVLDHRDELRRALVSVEKEAEGLASHRLLIGSLTGDALETRVLGVLAEVLDGSGLVAEDREDIGREDFLLAENGQPVALGEVKGVSSHISRQHVNQVDNNRAEAEYPVEMPGLLIVNIFRMSDSLEKREEPVHKDIAAHAKRQNVLVLRTLDLYNLLALKLAGNDPTPRFRKALLEEGGGWLRVDGEGLTVI